MNRKLGNTFFGGSGVRSEDIKLIYPDENLETVASVISLFCMYDLL